MSDEKRQYRMKRRAEQEAETRLRITESAVDLHGTLGPARTSVSAVAERAGVRRSTVYRHFPDERALFGACSAHWMAANPPPDFNRWRRAADPDERLEVALGELYSYYRRTGSMLDRLLRDQEAVPVVGELMGAFWGVLGEATEILMRGRGLRGAKREAARVAIGHALAFTTWQDLTGAQGLDDEGAAELMSRFISSGLFSPRPSP
jgi:AcrR family transcriptional regulator